MDRHDATTAIVNRITDARARDYLLHLHLYCDNNCPAREIDVFVKDHDDQLLALIGKHGVRCPLCARPLLCGYEGVLTAVEQQAADDRDARCSVNRQLYERDHGLGVPLDVLLDDSLPTV